MRVGLVGTGYAAKLRAEAIALDQRSHLVAVAGHTDRKTQTFAQDYECGVSPWTELVQRSDVDLVIVCNVNQQHGEVVEAALRADKHVVVEYPLALDIVEASRLISLAKAQNKLLHVEHIELLGGLHNTLKQYLPQLGDIFYTRYSTVKPENTAPRKWTYSHQLFGFPLMGALSRLHRLIDLFGEVVTVNCHARFWSPEDDFYQSCLCTTQLNFASGLLGEVIYGKGEALWHSERKFEIQGSKGGLIIEGDRGLLIAPEETTPIEVGNRRGLFAKDTSMVLDHLTSGTPLYVTPDSSLYTLQVADAARRAAESGLTTVVTNSVNSNL